jgi:hypothetical protein
MYTPRGASSRLNRSQARSQVWTHHAPLRSILFFLLALTGVLSAASAQSLSPGGPVDLGSVDVGITSGTTTLIFSVPGSTVVTVGSITATTFGATGKDFAVASQTCVGTLAGPTTCNILLTFTPSVLGLRLGELFIKDGSGNITNRVPLRGAGLGPQLSLSPSAAVATTTAAGIAPANLNPSSTVYDGNGNLFIDDSVNGRILEEDTSGNFTVVGTIPASPSGAPFSSITITGDGTLYISSPTTSSIYSLTPGGVATLLPTPGITLGQPTGLAADGFGYLYVADAGKNQIDRIDLENGNTSATLTLTGLTPTLAGPEGLSVNDADMLFVADANNNRIVSIDLHASVSLTNAATPIAIAGETLSAPSAVAVNAAGGFTITDTGNSRLVENPATGSAFVLALTGATLSTPAGITLMPNGDLLVSDTVAGLVQITRTASAATFPTSTLVGTTDTADGDIPITVENTGSYPVQLSSGAPNISTGSFFNDTTSTCPGGGSQIATGTACLYEFGFSPTVKGVNTATATIGGNGVGGANAPVTTTVALTGTGYVELAYFTVVITPSTVNPGQPTTITITAYNNDNSLDNTYTGTITFSCTDPACKLPASTYTFTAADNGTHTFPSTGPNPLNFNTLGNWTVTVADPVTIPGKTITGTSNTVTVVTTPAITLTSSVNPVNVNATTTLTATVTSTFGTPSGAVTFLDGTSVLGTATLNASGVATLNVSFSSPGQHPLTANYPGSGFFQAVTSATLIETVDDFTPGIVLTSSVNPIGVGSPTTLTATLTSSSGTPTGTVTFLDGTKILGTGTLNASGVATLSVSFSTVGQHTLTVTYPGNGFFQAGTSAPLIELVGDFSLSFASTSATSATVILGGSANFNLIVAPIGTPTLAVPVTLSISGLPTGATATFVPPTVAAGLSNTPVTLTINAPPIVSSSLQKPVGPSPLHRSAPVIFALLLLPVGLFARRKRIVRLLVLFVAFGAISTGLTGCLSNDTMGYYAQPPETYTLTVSGTSGTLVHSVHISFTVE